MRQGSPRLAVAAFLALLLLAAPAAAQDRTWAAPVDVSAGTDQRAAPNVLFAPDRTAHALWFEIVGGAAVLRHAQRPLGGAWSQPVTVSEAGVYQQSTIEAGIDQDGDLTVAWSRDDVIEAKTKPSGGPWPATADVLSDAADTTTPGGVPMNPDVAVASGGQAVVVWEQSGKILAARRPEGGSWTRDQIGANGASPSVGLDGDGAAVVIWPGVVQGAPDREYVGTNQMSAGGAWGTAGELPGTSYDDNSALYISVELAVSAMGDAFAIWDMNRTQAGVAGGIDPVEGAIRPAGGAWTTPHTLAPGDHENNDNQGNLPRIATDPLGNAAAVFYEGPPNNLAVRAVDATAAGWGTPATIAPAGATSLNAAPGISVSPQGDALGAWPRSGHIDGAERLLGEPWPGTPEPISDPAGGTASAPRLAHDPSGDGMAVWATDTPAGSAVQSSLRDVPDQAPVVVPGPSGGGGAGGAPPQSTAGPAPDITDPTCVTFERLIGPLVARSACFRFEGALLMSRTPVRINGIDIVPASEADRI